MLSPKRKLKDTEYRLTMFGLHFHIVTYVPIGLLYARIQAEYKVKNMKGVMAARGRGRGDFNTE